MSSTPAESPPKLKIWLQEGRESGVVTIDKVPFRIGRLSESELKISDPCVSRQHAEILLQQGGAYQLVDRKSKSGTFVNGRRIDACVLKHNDRIGFGPAQYPHAVFVTNNCAEAAALETPQPLPAAHLSTTTMLWSSAGADLQNVSRMLESFRVFISGLPLSEIVSLVLDTAIQITMAERAFLVLKEAGQLRFQQGKDASGATLSERHFQVSGSVLKRVVDSGQKVMINDGQGGEQDLQQAASVVMLELRTIVCLPLKKFQMADATLSPGGKPAPPQEVIGALYLDGRNATGCLSSLSEGILDKLAADVSAVVENARLLKEVREKERLEMELATAQQIQQSLMPEIQADYRFFRASALNIPSRAISGDMYDLIPLPGDRYSFAIADVAGKGPPAAILSSLVQGMLFAQAQKMEDPLPCIQAVNRYLVQRTHSERFVSMFYATLDRDGSFRFVNAGHNPPFHITAEGNVEELRAQGVVLGVFEGPPFAQVSLQLKPGDIVCMYTDGITEASNPANELFGEDRLQSVLVNNRSLPTRDIVRSVLDSVARHCSGAPQSDDLTLFLVRYEG